MFVIKIQFTLINLIHKLSSISHAHAQTIASKIGKTEPFAMAHLRLMKKDETTIADGQHELYVYSVSHTLHI